METVENMQGINNLVNQRKVLMTLRGVKAHKSNQETFQ